MPLRFVRECAGDVGILAIDKDGHEYLAAMMFFSTKGSYPVFDIAAGGPPATCDTLPDALNRMLDIALILLKKGLPQ